MPRIQDLLRGSAYWGVYSLREEVDNGVLDEWGRVLAGDKDVINPKTSRYLTEKGFKIDYPEGKRFAICLTHDVDKAHVGAGRKLLNLSRGRLGGRTFRECLGDFTSLNRPNCNFDQIMDLEEEHGAKSTFFLLALEPGEKDYNYRVESLRKYISAVLDRDFEIGLHGGWHAYKDRVVLANEKRRIEKALNRSVVGYRNHYLLFDTHSTWRMLEEEGFEYDSTFGFPDAAGFRNGFCHPFNPYNKETDQAMRIVEFPIGAMDRSFESYYKIGPVAAWEKIKAILDVTERYGGVTTIIWHNVFMWGEWGKLYRKLLDYGNQRSAWMTDCSEIFKAVRDQI